MKLHEQTQQIQRIYDELYEIDDFLARATRLVCVVNDDCCFFEWNWSTCKISQIGYERFPKVPHSLYPMPVRLSACMVCFVARSARVARSQPLNKQNNQKSRATAIQCLLSRCIRNNLTDRNALFTPTFDRLCWYFKEFDLFSGTLCPFVCP